MYSIKGMNICVKDALDKGHVPTRFLNANSDEGDGLASRTIANNCGLYIHGRNGVGKTFLAVAILAGFIEATGMEVYFARATDLENTFLDFEDGEGARKRLDKMINAPLLVIDDFDKVITGRDFLLRKLFDLIDARYNSEQRTIFTSNCNPSELLQRFGDDNIASSILSRIAEMTEPCKLEGDDRRYKRTSAEAQGDNSKRFYKGVKELRDESHPMEPPINVRCKNGCAQGAGIPSVMKLATDENGTEREDCSVAYSTGSEGYRCSVCGEITAFNEIPSSYIYTQLYR